MIPETIKLEGGQTASAFTSAPESPVFLTLPLSRADVLPKTSEMLLRFERSEITALLNAIAKAAGTTLEDIVEAEEIRVDTLVARKGVSVYFTYTDVDTDDVSENWFATAYGLSSDHPDAFDVRELSDVPDELLDQFREEYDNEEAQMVAYAIDEGLITEEGRIWPTEAEEGVD